MFGGKDVWVVKLLSHIYEPATALVDFKCVISPFLHAQSYFVSALVSHGVLLQFTRPVTHV